MRGRMGASLNGRAREVRNRRGETEMNRDDICDFYLQVSKELCDGKEWCTTGISEPLQRFAALVAAHEREACARLLDDQWFKTQSDCAAAIRARGED